MSNMFNLLSTDAAAKLNFPRKELICNYTFTFTFLLLLLLRLLLRLLLLLD